MKRFTCACGRPLYFDNSVCLECGRLVGLDPEAFEFVVFGPDGTPPDGFRSCRNRIEHEVCNWVLRPTRPGDYCAACALNEMIPNLGIEGNRALWADMERAKRRLLYSLASIGLPLAPPGSPALRFRFLEDRRRNPDVEEAFVTTGHHGGVITINLAEADDVARTAIRQQMRENYRTLLGHLRHEAGHYYLEFLIDDPADPEFVALFGDLRDDYAAALARHYRDGPPADWQREHVSAYASAHPHEDWAEHFAHFVHISETLETAAWALPDRRPGGDWVADWTALASALNELNRSLGADLPYPFVLTDGVVAKLRFVSRRLHRRVGYRRPGDSA